MSRYVLPPEDDGLTIYVGWDPPLGTYFAHAEILTGYEGEDLLWWIGYSMHEIPTIGELRRALLARAIVIPKEIDDKLIADQAAPWTPGPLQVRLRFTGKKEDDRAEG